MEDSPYCYDFMADDITLADINPGNVGKDGREEGTVINLTVEEIDADMEDILF